CLTSDNVFDLDVLPRRLVVIGAGPIGCELSQAFARFGADVVLLDVSPRVLPNDDPEGAAIIDRALGHDGVRRELGWAVSEATSGTDGVRVSFARANGSLDVVNGERLLVAAGRVPVVDGLSLESAGVKAGPRGVVVDDRLRTTNPR